MKVQFAISVLSLVIFGCHATQWQDIKSPFDSPLHKQIFDKFFPAEADGGQNINGKITNGATASLGQFPFQVYLHVFDGAGNPYLCSGSIIHRRWILTAALCLDEMVRVNVFLGAINRYEDGREGAYIRMINVTNRNSLIMHPNFNGTDYSNNIALIELPDEVPLDHPLIGALPLPEGLDATRNLVGLDGTVAGFGRTSDTVPGLSLTLNFIRQPIAENSLCSQVFTPGLVTASNICLQSINFQSTCTGDAGGALTVVGANGQIVQVGVVSFQSTIGCTLGYPQVFTRVSSFMPWIDSHISPSRTCTCTCQSTCTVG